MNVLERLKAQFEPITDEYGDSLDLLAPCEEVSHIGSVRPVRLRAFMLARIAAAGEMLSFTHGLRRMYRSVTASIKAITPEMQWFRNYPKDQIQPAGREVRWGQS